MLIKLYLYLSPSDLHKYFFKLLKKILIKKVKMIPNIKTKIKIKIVVLLLFIIDIFLGTLNISKYILFFNKIN